MKENFDFGGRLTADFPSQIVVDATEVCNLACVHCPHPEFKKSEHYSGAMLPLELNNKLIDEVRELGKGKTQYIRYTSNGEPLTHPKIYEMLDYAVKNSGTLVTLTTNGKIMNEDRIAKLLSAGLDMVDVSIDAFSESTYASIRVGGHLPTTNANVRKLIEMKRRLNAHTKVIVSFIEQPNNKNEAEAFKNFWMEAGADHVVLRRLHSAAGEVTQIAHQLKGQQADQQRYPCLYPWERVLLNARGFLAFCPQDWRHGSELADYRSTTVQSVWTGPAYHALREAHRGGCFKGHEFCGNCPDWQQTRWPWMGRSYADLVDEIRQEQQKMN